MEYSSNNPDILLAGFEAAGGWYDKEKFALKQLPGMGLSAVALQDLPEDCPMFRVPESCILSAHASTLKDRLAEAEWDGLNSWSQLILVMMWEASRDESPWKWYLSSMPTRFSTPMFWSDEAKSQLKGTEIEDRVGRAEAEALYFDVLQPLIKARPDVFDQGEECHSLDAFHVQGSRILSRSFNVPAQATKEITDARSTSSDSDDETDEEIPVMIPIADALNAASNRNNARLFNGADEAGSEDGHDGYTMTSIEAISAGSQIFNTYLELPNSELLRKYGYVDEGALDTTITDRLAKCGLLSDFPRGSPFDEATVGADRILHFVTESRGTMDLTERVDWWLEEGQDDAFSIDIADGVDSAFHAFASLLLSDSLWRRARKKSHVPDGEPNQSTSSLLLQVINDRLSRYQSSMEDDLEAISTEQDSALRAALVVRIGEKRALLLAKSDCEDFLNDQANEAERTRKRAKNQ